MRLLTHVPTSTAILLDSMDEQLHPIVLRGCNYVSTHNPDASSVNLGY